MEMLFNVVGQAAKDSLKRVFLEAMAHAVANAAGNAVVNGVVSAVKGLKEIDRVEVTIEL